MVEIDKREMEDKIKKRESRILLRRNVCMCKFSAVLFFPQQNVRFPSLIMLSKCVREIDQPGSNRMECLSIPRRRFPKSFVVVCYMSPIRSPPQKIGVSCLFQIMYNESK